MASSKYPPLKPLWMERNTGFGERLKPFLGAGFPSWDKLMQDQKEIQARIAAKSITWPPADLEFIHAISRNQIGDPNTVAPEFRLLNVFQAAHLPSVKEYLDRATALFAAAPAATHAPDPDQAFRRPLLVSSIARLAWERYGKQVYVIDPDTYELLVQTDLPGLPSRMMRAPLPAFYLMLPPESFYFIEPASGHRHEAEGAIVLFDRIDGDDGYGRSITVLLTGKNMQGGEDSFLYSYAFFSPMTPINEVRFHGLETVLVGEGVKEAVHDVPHAIFAFCLYLMSEHPDLTPVKPVQRDLAAIKNPAKRRKAEKRNAQQSALGYIYVGGREAGARPEPGTSQGPKGRLTRPSWVRGHWRNQPYGPGRKQYKLIWIKPHLRGPDFSESLKIRAQKVQSATRKSDS